MPGKVTKTNGYRATWGGKTTAKRTTKGKAEAQLNLLRAKEHNPKWKPTGKPARYKRKKRRVWVPPDGKV